MRGHYTKSGSFEGDTIAAMLKSGGFHLVALQRYFIESQPDGSAIIHCETNDDNDDGIPDGQWVDWDETYPSLKKALKNYGKCRIGVSGVIVTVTLDGEEIR